jgi:Helicase conserved C-terminal domain/Transcription factor Tfb2
MKLAECLNTADISTLRAIAERYDLHCSRHSKLSLLQEILYTFQSSAFLQEHMETWVHGREYAMLRLSLEQRRTFSQEELVGVLQGQGDDNALDKAVQEGWLFPTTRYGGRLLYCVPEELQSKIRGVMVQRFSKQLETMDDGPLLYQEEGHAMVRDVDVFLEYVRNHDVRLTTDGSIYKRNLTQILELLEVPEEPLQSGWRFGYGRRFHDYPDRFALLYDYAYHANLISEDNDGLLRLADGVAAWAGLDMLDRQRAFVRFYMSTYRRPIKRLPQVAQLIAHAARKWTCSDGMLTALSDLVQPYYYDEQHQVWKTRILKMLMHLGLIRTGSDESGREWFQITQLGQQLLTPDALPVIPDQAKEKQRILIVQPNFEIVVTTDQPMITAELSLFTELRQAGVIRVYRMTEESVQKGVAAGKSLTAWLDFLQTYSQTPVPGNVERTLEEWDRVMRAERAVEDDTLTS